LVCLLIAEWDDRSKRLVVESSRSPALFSPLPLFLLLPFFVLYLILAERGPIDYHRRPLVARPTWDYCGSYGMEGDTKRFFFFPSFFLPFFPISLLFVAGARLLVSPGRTSKDGGGLNQAQKNSTQVAASEQCRRLFPFSPPPFFLFFCCLLPHLFFSFLSLVFLASTSGATTGDEYDFSSKQLIEVGSLFFLFLSSLPFPVFSFASVSYSPLHIS